MRRARLLVICLFAAAIFPGLSGCGGLQAAPAASNNITQQLDFNFIFKYGVSGKNTLNTFQGTFIKDMGADPAIAIELKLTPEEQKTIFEKMTEMDFFGYPDKFSIDVADNETKVERIPYPSYLFKVQNGGKVRELLWHDKYFNSDARGDKLKELINLIINIIESKEEYQKLPEPREGYS
jgi:hypothetical protein